MDNVADLTQVENKKKKDKLVEYTEATDFKFLVSTDQGRRFIWRYLSFAGVFEQTANPHSGSMTYFNEGRRSVGLKLFAELNNFAPDALHKMIMENKKGKD